MSRFDLHTTEGRLHKAVVDASKRAIEEGMDVEEIERVVGIAGYAAMEWGYDRRNAEDES